MFVDIETVEHERVVRVQDKTSGLDAVIAIHSTALGPAGGGCRLWNYGCYEDALTDALNLSKGMSYKNAMANLALGGGKAVILGPLNPQKREDVFKAFGCVVEALGGDYVTAEDVGVRVADMMAVSSQTSYVSGLQSSNGVGGDPSPFTARGVLQGIKAAAAHRLGSTDLSNLRIAVQGLGGVGGNLCRLLAKEGADIVITDINETVVQQIETETNAKRFDMASLYEGKIDIFAPCALGGVISEQVAETLDVKIVAGGANNQLLSPRAGDVLHQRGILYAPDYVINAGGIIVVDAEYRGRKDQSAILANVDAIGTRLTSLFEESGQTGRPTYELADERACEIISIARQGHRNGKVA